MNLLLCTGVQLIYYDKIYNVEIPNQDIKPITSKNRTIDKIL